MAEGEGGGFPMGDILGDLVKAAGIGVDWYRGDKAARATDSQWRQNMQMQSDLAYHGIQRKVQDARESGIHPIYALGGSAASGSVVSPTSAGESTVGRDMGQSLGRAVRTYLSPEERVYDTKMKALDLESRQLGNDILRARLASMVKTDNQPGDSPGMDPNAGTQPIKSKQEDLEQQLRIGGVTFPNDPYTSDSNTAENILGDVADNTWIVPKGMSMAMYKAKLIAGALAQLQRQRANRRRDVPFPYRDIRRGSSQQMIRDYMTDWKRR